MKGGGRRGDAIVRGSEKVNIMKGGGKRKTKRKRITLSISESEIRKIGESGKMRSRYFLVFPLNK